MLLGILQGPQIYYIWEIRLNYDDLNKSVQFWLFCTVMTKEGQNSQVPWLPALTWNICLRFALPDIMYLG